MYDELIKRLRNCATQAAPCKTCDMIYDGSCSDTLMKQAADAIEELQDKVNRAIGFWDSAEIAEVMRDLDKYLPDISDPEWQKYHMDMGFYSPIGEVYKDMGLYDEPPKEKL